MTAADKIAEARALIADMDSLASDNRALGDSAQKSGRLLTFAYTKRVQRVLDAFPALADLADAQAQENARLRYVLEGVRGAIDTGRNEPLMIWRDQINIALGDAP